jgi:hypothetical protein
MGMMKAGVTATDGEEEVLVASAATGRRENGARSLAWCGLGEDRIGL